MMKKIISLLLAALMLTLALASCGQKKTDPLTYRYQYDLSEYIDLAPYKGVAAEGYEQNITDDIIEQQINSTLLYYGRAVPVTDRGAETGDTLNVDYTLLVDGKRYDTGASTRGYEFLLGSESFPPDIEHALIGAKAGDTITADTVLENLENEDFAGKKLTFNVTVNSISEKELPEYSEDFVRAYLGFESKADFEEKIRESLEEHYQEIYEQMINEQVWEKVVNGTTVKAYPEKEVKELYDEVVSANQALAMAQGADFGNYLMDRYEMTEDEFYTDTQERAEAHALEEMVVYAIARAENITISDEEYAERAAQYAVDSGYASVEEMEADFDRATICQYILTDKVHEAVVSYADVTFLDPMTFVQPGETEAAD